MSLNKETAQLRCTYLEKQQQTSHVAGLTAATENNMDNSPTLSFFPVTAA